MTLFEALQLKSQEQVCFVGAGGKTSLMQKLASECATRGGRVLVTTSTKMYQTQLEACGPMVLEQDGSKLLKKLRNADSLVVAAGTELTASGKVLGYSGAVLDLIYCSGIFNYLLVEADGSRGKNLKAPGDNEPVIPVLTTCVLSVIGLGILGRPLTEEYVHRPELMVSMAKQKVGTLITEETIIRVIERYHLLINSVCHGIRFVPVINQVDSDQLLEKARRLALRMRPAYEKVLITSTIHPDCVREVIR